MSRSSRGWNTDRLYEVLARDLRPLEHLRRQIIRKRKNGLVILGITGFIIAVGIISTLPTENGPLILLLGGITFACIAWFIYHRFLTAGTGFYRHEFKKRVVGGIAKALEPGIEYQPYGGIGEDWFRGSQLYKTKPDRYDSEDLFSGRIGKTQIKFSEIDAAERNTDSDGNTTYSTIFKGILFVADFHKDFRSWVTVMPDIAERNFGFLGKGLQNLIGKVERLENPEFEKYFIVRGGDPVETRYLITPKMQENLLSLRERFGSDFRMALHSSSLWLALPIQSDWFEANLHTPATSKRQIKKLFSQIATIFHIVENLDLNTRIWTKR